MELLFKREQTTGKMSRVNFKLWGKLEVSEDEKALINRYRFDESILIGDDDTDIKRKAIKRGILVGIAATIVAIVTGPLAIIIGPAAWPQLHLR